MFRHIGPISVKRADIQYPLLRTVPRSAWGYDGSWVSTQPRLNQYVTVRGVGKRRGITFPKQQALSIDARGPFDNGWKYFDDADPDTPACRMVGKIEWQRPKIVVRQFKHEVRVAAISQRTEGDRTGCILGFEEGTAYCPNLTRVIYRLKKPLGKRRLILEQFQ